MTWQVEIGEPLLQLEAGEGIVPSSLLASLLSLILALRLKLEALGAHSVIDVHPFSKGAKLMNFSSFRSLKILSRNEELSSVLTDLVL
jgi:hypothetical protein